MSTVQNSALSARVPATGKAGAPAVQAQKGLVAGAGQDSESSSEEESDSEEEAPAQVPDGAGVTAVCLGQACRHSFVCLSIYLGPPTLSPCCFSRQNLWGKPLRLELPQPLPRSPLEKEPIQEPPRRQDLHLPRPRQGRQKAQRAVVKNRTVMGRCHQPSSQPR